MDHVNDVNPHIDRNRKFAEIDDAHIRNVRHGFYYDFGRTNANQLGGQQSHNSAESVTVDLSSPYHQLVGIPSPH